jgi:hypothetical protein
MAKRQTQKTVKHLIEVSDEELRLIMVGLHLINDFGNADDWDDAANLRCDLEREEI